MMSNSTGKVTTLLPKDKKEGEGSEDSKKRGLESPAGDNDDDASSENSRRVSRRKRAKVPIFLSQ